jgi:hypothetical protein
MDAKRAYALARLIEEVAQGRQQASRFATQRGSLYVQLPDGTTLRHKAMRPEHGNDFGWMARSDHTAYLTPQDANALSLVEARADRPFRLIRDTASPRLAVMQEGNPRPIRGTIVPYAESPGSGLLPLETWLGRGQHFGNPITAVDAEPNWADWLERAARGLPPPDRSW